MTKTRRTRNKRANANMQRLITATQKLAVTPKRKKKSTPFADAGAVVGGRLAQMLGHPQLKGVGRWLGSGIGTIFGSGEYSMVGNHPEYNTLINDQIPKFSTTRSTNVISHREFLGDITGTTAFTNRSFPINPGMSQTFPWLATVAQNYQEYRIHGMIFEFRSLITDFVTGGAPGVVVMATTYNADAPDYNSKVEMENSEFAVAVKPTCNLIHGIECATNQTILPELYVRTGAPPANQDLRLYDRGKFQLATQGNPNQLLGELWVSYNIEFYKPIMPDTIGGTVQSWRASRTTSSGINPFGLIGTFATGTMTASITPTSLTIDVEAGNIYFISFAWYSSSVTFVAPIFTMPAGLTTLTYFDGNTVNGNQAPQNGILGVSDAVVTFFVRANVSGSVTLTVGTAGTVPASVDIIVTNVDSTL